MEKRERIRALQNRTIDDRIQRRKKGESARVTKTIIFDLDGTLLQTHIHSCAAAHETLARLGLTDVADEAVERLIGEPPAVFFESLAPGYPDMASLETLFDALEQEMLKERAALYDGVSALLEQLRNDGYLLALCSNGSRAYVEAALTATGIRAYFCMLSCAGEYPDKTKAVGAIIRVLGSKHAAVVGDRSHDLEAAAGNRVPFIAAAYGYGAEELQGALYRAQKPEDIPALLKQIEPDFI